jgi:hypothetical protein
MTRLQEHWGSPKTSNRPKLKATTGAEAGMPTNSSQPNSKPMVVVAAVGPEMRSSRPSLRLVWVKQAAEESTLPTSRSRLEEVAEEVGERMGEAAEEEEDNYVQADH